MPKLEENRTEKLYWVCVCSVVLHASLATQRQQRIETMQRRMQQNRQTALMASFLILLIDR